MAAPKRSAKRGSKRFYSWRGKNHWSVTTIIDGGIPKRALIYWSANEVAGYVVANIDEVAALIAKDPEGAYDLLKRTPWRSKEKAADAGTAIHEAVEAYTLGRPMPTWPEPVAAKMAHYERFLADYQPVFHMTEASVYNATERYAGTLDAIVTIGGRTLVFDMKSGKGVYPEVGLQLAAYRFAEFVGLPDGSEAPMPETDGAVALHLTDEDYDLLEIRADQTVFKSFLYTREVVRFIEETSKSVVGDPVPFPGDEAFQGEAA